MAQQKGKYSPREFEPLRAARATVATDAGNDAELPAVAEVAVKLIQLKDETGMLEDRLRLLVARLAPVLSECKCAEGPAPRPVCRCELGAEIDVLVERIGNAAKIVTAILDTLEL